MRGCPYNDAALISIHALREEGDHNRRFIMRKCIISIHALREEGDHDAGKI